MWAFCAFLWLDLKFLTHLVKYAVTFAIRRFMSAKGLWAVRLPEYRFDYRPDV